MFTSGNDFGDTHRGSAAWACFVDDAGTTSPLHVWDELPWVDIATLEDLQEQVGSRDIAWRFVHDYAQMSAKRHSALMTAVEHRHPDAALDAVLSLKNSSAMVGGVRLARAAQALEAAIRTGVDLSEGPLLDAVADYGRGTVNELERIYLCNGPRGDRSVRGC